MFKTFSRRITLTGLISCLLAGCASAWHPKTPEDPYESYNRSVFKFNLAVDRHVYRPIAKGYDTITPDFVQNRISNFFSNINQVPTVANDILQVNAVWTLSDVTRLLINTTVGIGGLFDPATHMGFKKHPQDFGLTLAKWGVRESPYFIFPFLPPSTARDFLGAAVDSYPFSVWTYINPDWIGYTARGLDFVQLRAKLLGADKWVDQAFDPYVFVRDFYLQSRHAKIEKVLHPEQAVPQAAEVAPLSPQSGETASATGAAEQSDKNISTTPKPTAAQNDKSASAAPARTS